MRYPYVLVVLTLLGGLWRGGLSALAQAPTLARLTPPAAAPAAVTPPGEAPTPQFLRVTIDLEAGGLTLRLHYDPAWVALHQPHVRVGPAPTPRAPAEDVPPPLQGRGDAFQQALEALEQASPRAQPTVVPSP
jgi:hypothetical protein